jgi:hypothetical protein
VREVQEQTFAELGANVARDATWRLKAIRMASEMVMVLDVGNERSAAQMLVDLILNEVKGLQDAIDYLGVRACEEIHKSKHQKV